MVVIDNVNDLLWIGQFVIFQGRGRIKEIQLFCSCSYCLCIYLFIFVFHQRGHAYLFIGLLVKWMLLFFGLSRGFHEMLHTDYGENTYCRGHRDTFIRVWSRNLSWISISTKKKMKGLASTLAKPGSLNALMIALVFDVLLLGVIVWRHFFFLFGMIVLVLPLVIVVDPVISDFFLYIGWLIKSYRRRLYSYRKWTKLQKTIKKRYRLMYLEYAFDDFYISMLSTLQ